MKNKIAHFEIKQIDSNNITTISVPYLGMILSNKYPNSIIILDKEAHHDDNLSQIIQKHYMDDYFTYIDIQPLIHYPESHTCIDASEILFSIYLASLGETVILNSSDEDATELLIEQKERIYNNNRNFYNFGMMIYLPNDLEKISELDKQLLYSLREYFDLLNQSCPIEILLVPTLENLKNEELQLIHLEEMFELLEHQKRK